MKRTHNITIWAILFFIGFVSTGVQGAQHDSIIKDLDEIISLAKKVSPEKYDRVKRKIEKNPEKILPLLLSKANQKGLTETGKAIYIWAIGVTKSPKAIDDLIRFTSEENSEMIMGSAFNSLASIGGKRAGQHIFSRLKKTNDPMMRFNLLNLLAQIQYIPALPAAMENLKKDPKKNYWQNVFIFGKYGDDAVPFLLKKIKDKNQNVRTNAIVILGQWLTPRKVLKPLKRQFWKEKNPQTRVLILSSIERVNTDLDDLKTFFEQVLEKEKHEKVAKFAEKTISSFDQMKKNIDSFRARKKKNKASFKSEYKKILNSFGKEGDYDKLALSSTRKDEKKLKRLKQIILHRNSDESFRDYQKVNNIILFNRLI